MTHYATRICTALAMLAGAFFASHGGANAADMKSGETKPQAMKHGHAMHARHGQMHHGMKMDAAMMAHHREMMKMHAKHHGKCPRRTAILGRCSKHLMKRPLRQSAHDTTVDCISAECHRFFNDGTMPNTEVAHIFEVIRVNRANHNVLIMF